MSKKSVFHALSLLIFSAFLVIPREGMAQQRLTEDDLRIRRLESNTVRTPQYQVRGPTTSGSQGEWLEVRTQFETRPDWIDELTFTYYIVLQNPRPERGQNPFTLLTGETTYINIEQTRRGLSTVYVHPSTVERFGNVERVGVVISAGGRTLAMESDPSHDGRWWEQLSPQPGLVYSRDKSPFALVNIDDFPAIKPSDR